MYYPKSQVKINLYTNGGELVNATTLQDYVGYYYETSNGEKFIGKSPRGNSQVLLIPPPLETSEEVKYTNKFIKTISWSGDADPVTEFDDDLMDSLTVSKYLIVNSKGIPPVRKIPTLIKGYYTLEDKKKGSYLRYFTKRLNNSIYYEISKEDFDLLRFKDPKIAFDLYGYCSILWSIDNQDGNMGNASIIERNKKWQGFSSFTETLSTQLSPYENLSTLNKTNPSLESTSTTNGRRTSGGGGGGY